MQKMINLVANLSITILLIPHPHRYGCITKNLKIPNHIRKRHCAHLLSVLSMYTYILMQAACIVKMTN
jgi:hypothetical protein